MKDTSVASTRTGVNATAFAVVAYVITNIFGWDIDFADPSVILIIGGGATLFHRITTILSELWPPFGYLFFGVRKAPIYTQPPATE